MRWYALSVFACLAVHFLVRSARVRSRASARRNLEKHLGADEPGRLPLVVRLASRLSAGFDRTRHATTLREALARSGFETSWESFRMLWLAALALLPMIARAVTGSWLSVPPTVFLLLALPRPLSFALRRRSQSRTSEQCERLASDLALYLRCGIPVEDSLALCARDLGPPLTDLLARFQAEVSLGADSGPALLDLVGALDNQDLELIARAAVTSRETGADIREIMGNIGDAVRERAAIRRELYTQTVQGRMSGRIVAGLPLIFLGLSAVVSRGTLSVLLGTVPGLVMLFAAAVMDLLGFLWIRRILDIKT